MRLSECTARYSAGQRISTNNRSFDTLVEGSRAVIPPYTLQIRLIVGEQYIEINAVLDTGSPISVISKTLVPVNLRKLYISNNLWTGIIESKLVILVLVKQNLSIPDVKISVTLNLVTKETLTNSCVFGKYLFVNPLEKNFFGYRKGM